MSDPLAASSKLSGKIARVAQRCAAAHALREAEFWTESVVVEWIALRTAMFVWLETHAISYQGTGDAIVLTIRNLGSVKCATDLLFLYHVATLAEWDEDFAIGEQQAALVQKIGESVRMSMLKPLHGGDQ